MRRDNGSYRRESGSRAPEASYDEASRSRYGRRTSDGPNMGTGEGRMRILIALAAAAFVIVFLRLVYIQVVDGPRLAKRAEDRRTNVVTLNAKRGTIYDRNGNVLAISVDCKDIVCDPTTVMKTVKNEKGKTSQTTDGAADDIADVLVEVLGGDRDTYLEALTRTGTRYAYLSKRVDVSKADQVAQELSDKGLSGVYYESNTKRVYPYGTTCAQILGYVNQDGAALSGLETGTLTKDTTFNIPAEVLVGDDVVHDDDNRDYSEDMTVEQALAKSSNVAMAYYVQNVIGSKNFADGVQKFGIGQKTGIDFPGEAAGIVRGYDDYDGSTAGSMAFGQSLAIPLVQIVRAFGAVANDGVPTTPHFLVSKGGDEVDWPVGERIISKQTADTETEMMRTVMTDGTGVNGAIGGYDIAGKTGTGEQADENGGYKEAHFVASLCGFANAEDPQVLVYVGLNGIPYLASDSAANVFRDVMEQSVTILGIAPSAS